jgi:hypothetical protein
MRLSPSVEREGGAPRLAQQGERDAEAAVGRLGAGDRLEHEIDRRALGYQRERRRDMGQDA